MSNMLSEIRSGKSSLVLRECLQEVRGNALFGQAKFDPGDPTPYSAIVWLYLNYRVNEVVELTRNILARMSFGDLPTVPHALQRGDLFFWRDPEGAIRAADDCTSRSCCSRSCVGQLTSSQNITLLYAVVPEIEHLVRKVWANNFAGPVAVDALGTAEARTRFENLMVDILAELSSSRMIILVRALRLTYRLLLISLCSSLTICKTLMDPVSP